MDNIVKNQPDEHKNLSGGEATKKMSEMIEKTKSCFFSTMVAMGETGGARPMSVQKIDDQGNLWFLSANDNSTSKEIHANPKVHLYFQGADFLHLYGVARISEDKQKIKELWEPGFTTWFSEGENDPRICVIKVTPTGGYYWDSNHGNALPGIKMLVGIDEEPRNGVS